MFDVSVPTTHAFVANGIVNHNTVNLPEEATVEEVEAAPHRGVAARAEGGRDLPRQLQGRAAARHPEEGRGRRRAWPNQCRARIVERVVEHLIVQEPVRQKLPRTAQSKTFSFRVADCHGYVTVGEFEDGRPGELFLRVAKQGSTLAGIMDAFAISVSHGLQYGVPLEAFVDMFTNMRFEPAGHDRRSRHPVRHRASSTTSSAGWRWSTCPEERVATWGCSRWGSGSSRRCPGVEEAADRRRNR